MPYGLTGATQTCQRGLDELFSECNDCVDNYVDDIIIFSDDINSHITDLTRVFEKLRVAGFTLKGSKCLLCQSSITHLGFQYSHEVSPHPLTRLKSLQSGQLRPILKN